MEIQSYVGMLFSVIFSLPLVIEVKGIESALTVATALLQFPMVSNSIFFNEIFIQPIQMLASSIPPEAAAAAQKSGQHLPLEEIVSRLKNTISVE